MEEQTNPTESHRKNVPTDQLRVEPAKPWQNKKSSLPLILDLESAISRVGQPVDVFRCVNVLLLVWALSGLLLIVGCVVGLIGLLWMIFVKHILRIEMLQAIMLPLGVWMGWELARSAFKRMGSRVLLCEDSRIYHHRNGVLVFPWSEIGWICYDDETATLGRSGFPQVKMITEFTVIRTDSVEFRFSLYNLRRHIKLARAIFNATQPLGAKWSSWSNRFNQ